MKLSLGSEHQLIHKCLEGCETSWARLFEYCHPTIVRLASTWLGRQGGCGELAEEVAGRVWLKLVDGGYRRLAKFDPQRGVRITTFLVALARQEFLQFQRERRRRLVREKRGAERASHRNGQDSEVDILLNEWLGRLASSDAIALDCQPENRGESPEPAGEDEVPLDPEGIRRLATLRSAYQKKLSTRQIAARLKK